MRNYIVLVSKDHYNPLGIVRTLGEAGKNPIVIVVKGRLRLTAKSRYVKIKHYVANTEEGIKLLLSKYANANEKSFILTGDDVTVSVLDAHYDELKDYFYFYNAGKQGCVRKYLDKTEMFALAEQCGFKVPRTWRVKTGDIPADIDYPIITKAINSFGKEWKEIVYICRNESELKKAFEGINSESVLIQQYIDKVDEQGCEGFSVNQGKDSFFSVWNSEVYHLPGKYAPYWKNSNVDDKQFIEKAAAMIAGIHFEGIFEFEFIVDKSGELYFLEINLRNTVNGWSTTVAGMPSAVLWCESMIRGEIDKGYYKKIPEGFTTMAECFDYDARVKTGIISHKEWMKQYRSVNAKLYRGRKDYFPFLYFMLYKLFKMKH